MDQRRKRAPARKYSMMIWTFLCLSGYQMHAQTVGNLPNQCSYKEYCSVLFLYIENIGILAAIIIQIYCPNTLRR